MVLPLCGDGYCLSPLHGLNSSEVVEVPESDTTVTYSRYISHIPINLNPPLTHALPLIGCVNQASSTSGSFWEIISDMAEGYISGQQEADFVNCAKASWIAVL